MFPFAVLPDLADLLRRQWDATMQLQVETGRIVPWVFHRHGRPIKSFYGAWREACRKAGVPDRIPHDFRRTAVRNLERAGVPRSVAMKLTGHKTESVYRRYAIVSEADLSDGLKKLARLHHSDREQSRTVTKPLQSSGFSLAVSDAVQEDNSSENWCRRPGSNRYGPFGPQDFKSCAYACFATPASKTTIGAESNIRVGVGQGGKANANSLRHSWQQAECGQNSRGRN